MAIVIRCADGGDQAAISQLHIKSWRQTYQGILSEQFLQHQVEAERSELWQKRLTQANPNQQIWLACDEGQVVGFVCIYLDEHPEYGTLLDNLHVDDSAQGRGIGKALMAVVFDFQAQYYHDEGLYLEVLAGNVAAQKFYQALGATEIKTGYWQAPDGQQVKELIYYWPPEFFTAD